MNQKRQLTGEEKQTLLDNNNYATVTLTDAPGCVDGRKGRRHQCVQDPSSGQYTVYPQLLGGSWNIAVVNWILNQLSEDFFVSSEKTWVRLSQKGFQIGIHCSNHMKQGINTDCGFGDNLASIIKTLKDNQENIWQALCRINPDFKTQENLWQEIVKKLNKIDLEKIPSGVELRDFALEKKDVCDQLLEGEHSEIAAIVNLNKGTSLDINKLLGQGLSAFNLDLWKLEEEAKAVGLTDKALEQAKLLTLGLYIATEIVLVENKGKPSLEILIRN